MQQQGLELKRIHGTLSEHTELEIHELTEHDISNSYEFQNEQHQDSALGICSHFFQPEKMLPHSLVFGCGFWRFRVTGNDAECWYMMVTHAKISRARQKTLNSLISRWALTYLVKYPDMHTGTSQMISRPVDFLTSSLYILQLGNSGHIFSWTGIGGATFVLKSYGFPKENCLLFLFPDQNS